MNNQQKKNKPRFSVILSIFVAIMIWGYVIGQINPQVEQKFNHIEVKIKNMEVLEEKNLILSEDKEYFVDVAVHARRKTLFHFRNEIELSIDVSKIDSKGTYNFEVNVDAIPKDIDLVSITPKVISLEVDEIIKDEKEVNINVIGKPQQGLAMIDYVISPKKVTLEGPENILNTVYKVVGDLNVQGADGDMNKTIELYAVDKEDKPVEGITIQPQSIEAAVNIGKTKIVDLEAVLTGTVKEGYMISKVVILPSQMTIGAKPDIIDAIDKIETEPIDVDNIDKTLEQEVDIVLPKDVRIMGAKPTVVVVVHVEKLESREFTVDAIDFINEPDDMNIQILENDLLYTVSLQGKKSDLDALEKDSIRLFVDLTDIQLGSTTLPIQLETLSGVDKVEIIPKSIDLQATEK
ncbi:MAG: YbbR-like domain-containing protein [Eubacteriales bacterium]